MSLDVLLHRSVRVEQLRILLCHLRPLLEVYLYVLLLFAHLSVPFTLRPHSLELIRAHRRFYIRKLIKHSLGSALFTSNLSCEVYGLRFNVIGLHLL